MKETILKYKKNILIIILLSILIYLYVLLKNDAKIIFHTILNIKLGYIFLLLGIVAVFFLIEGLTLHLFTRSKVKGVAFKDTFTVNLATQFFSGITPFASGGQPFQILYLNTRGIKTKDSTSIVMMNYIVFNLSFTLVGSILLLWKYAYFNQLLHGQGYLLLLGYLVNTIVTVLTFVLAFSKRIYHFLIDKLWVKLADWKLLKRFKLHEKTDKIKETIDGFNHEIKELNQNKKLLTITILLNILKIIILYSVPVFIFMGLGHSITNIPNFMIGAFFIAMIMAYIPLPGGTLGAEYAFNLIFLPMIGNKEMIVSTMFLWRAFTYYLFIILGAFSIFGLNYKKDLNHLNYQQNESVLKKKNVRYNN